MTLNYDLASLTKPLATAPLVFGCLDLDQDYRQAFNLMDQSIALTPKNLLSHCSGLPPWLPYRPEPISVSLLRKIPWRQHPLLEPGSSLAQYSDLNYRILAEVVVDKKQLSFNQLAAAESGLSFPPWTSPVTSLDPGPDHLAWRLCDESLPIPPGGPLMPHDINSRAGMVGHAGASATHSQFIDALVHWWSKKWPDRMAAEPRPSIHGGHWGLGLLQMRRGDNTLGELLAQIPEGALTSPLVLESASLDLSPTVIQKHTTSIDWWAHLAFTGPAIFFRPSDRACLGLLTHRRGLGVPLLSQDQMHDRRIELLGQLINSL